MKLLNRTLLLVLLLTLPLSAADPLYGVWKTRPSGKSGDTSRGGSYSRRVRTSVP